MSNNANKRNAAALAASQAASGVSAEPQGRMVHAYRREITHGEDQRGNKKVFDSITVDLTALCGEKILFKANDLGHFVAEVMSPVALNRLVNEIPTDYRLYDPEDESRTSAKPLDLSTKDEEELEPIYVLTDADGNKKVLDDMGDDELRDFAIDADKDIKLDSILSGDGLRSAIVAHFKVPA